MKCNLSHFIDIKNNCCKNGRLNKFQWGIHSIHMVLTPPSKSKVILRWVQIPVHVYVKSMHTHTKMSENMSFVWESDQGNNKNDAYAVQ